MSIYDRPKCQTCGGLCCGTSSTQCWTCFATGIQQIDLTGPTNQALCEAQAFRTRAEQAEKERDEAKAEVAACLEFLETEMGWEYFRAETLNHNGQQFSRENARKLKNFLAEKGHGIGVLKRLTAAEQRLKDAEEWLTHAPQCRESIYPECSCGLNKFLKKGEG